MTDKILEFICINIFKKSYKFKKIKQIKFVIIFIELLKFNILLTLVNSFAGNKITSKSASILFNTLKECKSSVEIIILNLNQLDDGMETLGKFIQNSQTIKNIDISAKDMPSLFEDYCD